MIHRAAASAATAAKDINCLDFAFIFILPFVDSTLHQACLTELATAQIVNDLAAADAWRLYCAGWRWRTRRAVRLWRRRTIVGMAAARIRAGVDAVFAALPNRPAGASSASAIGNDERRDHYENSQIFHVHAPLSRRVSFTVSKSAIDCQLAHIQRGRDKRERLRASGDDKAMKIQRACG